jgi:archaemetzincin
MKKFFTFLFLLSLILFACNRGTEQPKIIVKVADKKEISPEIGGISIKKKVALFRLGNFDIELFHYVQSQLDSFYNIQTIDCGLKELPSKAFVNGRDRYVADTLLDYLFQNKPQGAQYALGLTEKDICTKDGNNPYWGIFGLGWQPGPTCVISTKRFSKGVSNSKLNDRLSKIVLHEMGHNFGLEHCPDHECLMADADAKISNVDKEKKRLCESCRKQIDNFLKK